MSDTTTNEMPHLTVACVIEQRGKYLMVEETKADKTVVNQPAGHVDDNETLLEAAVREVLEETGWLCQLTHVLGQYQYMAPNGISYHRTCFIAEATEHLEDYEIDSDIDRPLWLNAEELQGLERQGRLRSPIVMQAIEDHQAGIHYPLALIRDARS